MADIDKIHYLTEAIYKNLLDNYSPGIKQLIASGRAFQKSLHSVVSSSKAYVDCIYGLAKSAQVCKGATAELGAALLQVAEVYKEINTQVLDNIKAFHAELLIPLESGNDSDAKTLHMIYKKYLAGHKFHVSPYEKAQTSLKKQKKKNKNKFGFDQKELQYTREVKESQAKLEVYHQEQLRTALGEERQRYCGLLTNICSIVRHDASHHSKAHELLTHRLAEWSDLCKNPHVLPDASERVISAFTQDDVYSTTDEMVDMRRSEGEYTSHSTHHTPAHTPHQQNQDSDSLTYGTSHRFTYLGGAGRMGSQDDYAVAGLQRSITFHDSPGPNTPHKVRAAHTHHATGHNQLSLRESDVITLIGAPRDGWQYGENMRTRRMGWFPVSFTEPLHTGSADAHVSVIPNMSLSQRVKSLGNLREVTDEDFNMLPNQNTGHHVMGGGGGSAPPTHSGYSDSDSGHGGEMQGQRKERPHSVYNREPEKQTRAKRCVSWAEGHQPLVPLRRHSLMVLPKTLPLFERIAEYLGGGIMHQQQSSPSPPLPPPPPPNNPAPSRDDNSPTMPPPPPPPNINYAPRPPFNHANSSPAMPLNSGSHGNGNHGNNQYGYAQDSTRALYASHGGGGGASGHVGSNSSHSPANSSSGYSGGSRMGYGVGGGGGGGTGGGAFGHGGDMPPPPPGQPPPPPGGYEQGQNRSDHFSESQHKKTPRMHDHPSSRIY